MRRAAAIALAVGTLGAVPAAAPAATVDVMVVGKQERVLHGPDEVSLKHRRVDVGARRCAAGKATALSALVGTRLDLQVRDYAACSRSPRDSSGLYVRRIGPNSERGLGGWVYKVGRRTGSTGAADPSGPFGDGRRLRDGQRVLWFYCRRSGACQRTLEVRPVADTVAPGAPLAVTVRGYDDAGRGKAIEGATVTLGEQTAVTGADGTATVIAPAAAGGAPLDATRDGMVPAYPRTITVR